MASTYLSIEALAERWNVSYDVVWRLIQQQKLTAMQIGRQWRISEEVIEAYQRARTQGPLPPKPSRAAVRSMGPLDRGTPFEPLKK